MKSPMLPRRKYSFIFLVLFVLCVDVEAEGVRFIWEGTYALEDALTKSDGGNVRRRIATYLPPGTLVFDVKNTHKENYNYGVTRYGEPLFVYKSSMSDEPLIPYDGKNIIFHKDIEICADEECEKKGWVERGTVLKYDEAIQGKNVIKISNFTKNSRFSKLYIKKSQLKKEIKKGFVTLYDSTSGVDRVYDRETSYRINELGTKCGDRRNKVNAVTLKTELKTEVEPTSLIPVIKDLFKINLSASIGRENTYETIETIGGDDISIEYRNIIVKKGIGDATKKEEYLAKVTYRCLRGEAHKIFIQQVTVHNSKGVIIFHVDFDKLHGSEVVDKPVSSSSLVYEIYKRNGNRPFLVSINNYHYFEDVVNKIYKETTEKDLVRVFIKEFNVTCSSAEDEDDETKSMRKMCDVLITKLSEKKSA